MTKGKCCCKYENAKGAQIIHIIDIINVVNLPRWIFSVWAKVDMDRWPIYSRMRNLSFYFFWALCLFILIGDATNEIFSNDESDPMLYINSMFWLSALCLVIIVDLHYCKVVMYHANLHKKRIEKEARKKAKKQRAEERYKLEQQAN